MKTKKTKKLMLGLPPICDGDGERAAPANTWLVEVKDDESCVRYGNGWNKQNVGILRIVYGESPDERVIYVAPNDPTEWEPSGWGNYYTPANMRISPAVLKSILTQWREI